MCKIIVTTESICEKNDMIASCLTKQLGKTIKAIENQNGCSLGEVRIRIHSNQESIAKAMISQPNVYHLLLKDNSEKSIKEMCEIAKRSINSSMRNTFER